MCRIANTDFEHDASSVPKARHLILELLDRWELTALEDLATLLASELVTNALVHVGGALRLTVAVADGVLEIGVTDHGQYSSDAFRPKVERLSTVGADGFTAKDGRGLLLVDSLASEWGVVSLADGKQVWFRLSAEEWSYRSACDCHGESLDRVLLESGRYALAMPGPWDA
jgi:anti-sigma regulatory factor (Ser/Thr protein kinase)